MNIVRYAVIVYHGEIGTHHEIDEKDLDVFLKSLDDKGVEHSKPERYIEEEYDKWTQANEYNRWGHN